MLEGKHLNARDIDVVICGAGPGSFTSLRVAASVAKGIAFASGAKMYAVPSLLLTFAGTRDLVEDGNYLSVLPAMRGEFFALELSVTNGVPNAGERYSIVKEEDLRGIAGKTRCGDYRTRSGDRRVSSRAGRRTTIRCDHRCRTSRTSFVGARLRASRRGAGEVGSRARATASGVSARVVPAAKEHLDSIVRIERESFSDPWSEQAFIGMIDSPLALVFVATAPDNTVVGYAAATGAWEDGEILNVAVDGTMRERGIGGMLLDAAISALREQRVSRVSRGAGVEHGGASALQVARFRADQHQAELLSEAGGGRGRDEAGAQVKNCN